jgi:hypothetical protein
MLQGLFVDVEKPRPKLRIITPDFVVYAATEDALGWIGKIRHATPASKLWVELQTPSGTVRGVFDGADCVAWDDGAKWRRLGVSFDQWDLITRRRYVPLSILLVAAAYTAMQRLATRLFFNRGRHIPPRRGGEEALTACAVR